MSLTSFSFVISYKDKENLVKKLSSTLQTPPTEHIDTYFVLDNCKIAIYKNFKCLVQGKNASKVIKKYFSNNSSILNKNSSFEVLQNKLNKNNDSNQFNIIGSDEVGVGDYFGGICVCAVYLSNNDISKLIELGVKDSKKMNDNAIVQIAEKLIKFVKYNITNIDANEYNRMYEKYKNTHIIKTYGHYKSINKLVDLINEQNLPLDKIIIDEYASQKNFNHYLLTLGFNNNLSNLNFFTNAENAFLAVAAASIIARYFFLKQIQNLSQQAGFDLPLGSWNNKIENATLKLLISNDKQKINMLLNKYVKKHFVNTTKIINKL